MNAAPATRQLRQTSSLTVHAQDTSRVRWARQRFAHVAQFPMVSYSMFIPRSARGHSMQAYEMRMQQRIGGLIQSDNCIAFVRVVYGTLANWSCDWNCALATSALAKR